MMETISSGKALAASIVTGVPTGIFAAITGESVSVAIGAGTAVLMFLFSMRNTSNEQYVKALYQQIQDATTAQKKDREQYAADVIEVNMKLADVQVQLHQMQTTFEMARKAVAAHSCPAAADPNLKCRLAETLSSLL